MVDDGSILCWGLGPTFCCSAWGQIEFPHSFFFFFSFASLKVPIVGSLLYCRPTVMPIELVLAFFFPPICLSATPQIAERLSGFVPWNAICLQCRKFTPPVCRPHVIFCTFVRAYLPTRPSGINQSPSLGKIRVAVPLAIFFFWGRQKVYWISVQLHIK